MATKAAAPARKTPRGEYIETDSGNKVSRKAFITGTANITLAGKTVIQADVHLRGDLSRPRNSASSSTSSDPKAAKPSSTSISIGRYTIISTGCVVKPPGRITRGIFTYYPIKIGDHVFVGPDCIVQSASIGSHVHIGDHSVLQPFTIIRDNVKILPYTVVPANMVIPPGCVVGGRPARILEDLAEGWGVMPAGGLGGPVGPEQNWVEGGDLRELVRSIR